MKVSNLLLGKPLATSAEHGETIGVAAGIPIFGLDGLTSAAYGPEQAMVFLIPLGLFGVSRYLLPVFAAILTLLVIVYFSYRQTIEAYPNGGGSFTVASENLGDGAGLLAAAALMIDYILTAAVGTFRRCYGAGQCDSCVAPAPTCAFAFCFWRSSLLVNMRGVK